jgi:hypothetical protein
MARPFDQAQPIYPPLNIAVPNDQMHAAVGLSEFERQFVGVHHDKQDYLRLINDDETLHHVSPQCTGHHA